MINYSLNYCVQVKMIHLSITLIHFIYDLRFKVVVINITNKLILSLLNVTFKNIYRQLIIVIGE